MLRSLLPSVLAGLGFFLAPALGLGHLLHPDSWEMLAFFSSLLFMNQVLIERGMANNRQDFVHFSMAGMIGRLLLSMIFLLVYSRFRLTQPTHFFLQFFVLYLFFLCFEIVGVYRNLRHFSEQKP